MAFSKKPKTKTVYECQQCGQTQSKWSGQCGECGAWNSLVETVQVNTSATKSSKNTSATASKKVEKLTDVEADPREQVRLDVGSQELSQVLGGGFVPGSVSLMAGEPGIGKSTLLSQLTLYFASKHGKVLYVCGEESVSQVQLRLERLSNFKKTTKQAKDNILLFPETQVEAIMAAMEQHKPVLTIIDSIQTMVCDDLTGMAGSVGQVRESGNRILSVAKSQNLTTCIVGHVTKGGSIAGPKVLEHMVDAVLTLTGERSGQLRILRSVKNRFGAVDEVGVFHMDESGLKDVSNPGSVFLDEVQSGVPGSAITVLLEGTRPILSEIQALVIDSSLPTPRRVAEGIKKSRLDVICAVLEKHVRLNLSQMDVFVNAVGGIKAHEPAADLAIALAIASSASEKPLPGMQVYVGEVGLLGEVRRVSQWQRRKKEAEKLGYNYFEVNKPLYQLVRQVYESGNKKK